MKKEVAMQLEMIRERPVLNYKNLEQLPDPVVRYFRKVLRDGQPLIRGANLTQTGEFRTGPKNKWRPFHAMESFSIDQPAFSWNATIRIWSFLKMTVQDAYCDGQAATHGKIGAVELFRVHNDLRLATAALQRFLAEAPWFPTILLPSKRVRWIEVDNNHAQAMLSDSGIDVSMYFEFSKSGEIIGVFTPGRYQYDKGEYHLEPWGGYFHDYENRNGILIPASAEVEWLSPEKNFCYYKGRIAEAEYEF
jgi:uncharacterized protein DUF6920